VTAPDLRIGQGYVRCGRCERVFNALLSLADDLDPMNESSASASARATGTTSVPAIELDEEAGREDEIEDHDEGEEQDEEEEPEEEEVEETADIPAPVDAPATAAGSTPADSSVDVFDSQGQATGSYETIVLEGDTFLQTEEHIDVAEIDQQIQQIARQIGNGGPAMVAEGPADRRVADAMVGNAPRAHWGWGVLVALLVLLLGAQLVHHNRQALVANPRLEQPLQAVYGLFGQTLEPSWDLEAYDLRQLGAEALGSSTTIVLRASVQNLAPHPQPPPLIRAVLQDRYGNAISTVAVLPNDYARGKAPARLAPQQRLDAELQLAEADARLHCSSEP
jgi:hypothetical protein